MVLFPGWIPSNEHRPPGRHPGAVVLSNRKKVLVTVFDPTAPDLKSLRLLDSLQIASAGKLAVIAVPALDLKEELCWELEHQ
jgi:hypothetical protein